MLEYASVRTSTDTFWFYNVEYFDRSKCTGFIGVGVSTHSLQLRKHDASSIQLYARLRMADIVLLCIATCIHDERDSKFSFRCQYFSFSPYIPFV